jgi:prepilin-type processing-associated H-X9-DG protein/prepilin-type N-terminal cleavage/methylation domain-containing protein
MRNSRPSGLLRQRGATPPKRFSRFHRDEGGFSLVEILVVILVVGILAGLVLPVFTRARDRAVQAVCKNHLKQMGLAVRLYLQYNDNTYFPYSVNTPRGTLYYYGLERPSAVVAGHVELDVTKGYLFPYYSLVSGVERCPAFDPAPANGKVLRGATLGFGYNRFGLSGRSASEVRNHEGIILFADCAHIATVRSGRGRSKLVVEEFRYVSPTDYTVHFRHAGEANILFCDGHVESRRPLKIFSKLPGSGVGMLNQLGDTSLFIP